MNLLNKDNILKTSILVYFVILPFIFLGSISNPFTLPRQLLTTVFLFLVLCILVFKSQSVKSLVIDKTVLLFFGFIVFSVFSISKSHFYDLSQVALSRYLLFFLFFLLIRHLLLSDFIEIKFVLKSVLIFGYISILVTCLAFLNKTINGQHLFRQVDLMSGTFGNKNFLSSILFLCLPFYFSGLSMSKKIKITSICAILITIALLVILRTRAVLISLGLYLFLLLFIEFKKRYQKRSRLIFLISTLILIGSFLYLFSIKGNFHSSSNIRIQYFYRIFSSETFYSRIEFWRQAFYMISDNFFSGIGVGNWIGIYPKYGLEKFSNPEIINGRMIISNPHNDFLMVFSEIGVFGFLCYIGIFISVLYQAYRISITSEKIECKNVVYFFLFIICYLVVASFDFPLARIEHQIILLVIFSIINAQYLKIFPKKRGKLPLRYFYFFSFIILVYVIIIVLFNIQGEQNLQKALRAEKLNDNTNAIFEFRKTKNYFFLTDNYALPLEWHMGKAAYNTGNFEESLNYYTTAYRMNPYSLVVNNDLGSAYIKNGDISKAVKHYKEALSISPYYEDALINLAATYYNIKKYDKAFEVIERCDIKSKSASYKKILIPIVERKLNLTLISINNSELNAFLQSKIRTEEELLNLYVDYKKNNTDFKTYIQTLIN